jgi:hypothetical protein
LHASTTPQPAIVPQSVHVLLLLSHEPAGHCVQVPVPSPVNPGAHCEQTELLFAVQVTVPLQFAIGVQAVHVAVPLP